jgi:hypothetical protein
MGVVATHTMVAGTTGSGFVGFVRNQAGSMSPTTTEAFGAYPTINYLWYEFFFMTIEFVGHLDNSSITGMTVTPAGGSTTTVTFSNYIRDNTNNTTRWSDGSTYPDFVSGTTYTIQILGTTTDMNTEGTTLERRNPKGMDDFYGATRNVPVLSGAFKLSWLHDAVKYSHTSAMTSVQYTHAPGGFAVATYTGYSTTILPALGLSGTLGSMSSPTVSGIINYYQGATVQQLMQSTFPSSPSQVIITFIMDQTALDANSQWYKVSLTPTGGGTEIAFYREDLTYSRSGIQHSWTKDYGTPQLANGTTNYDFKLVC